VYWTGSVAMPDAALVDRVRRRLTVEPDGLAAAVRAEMPVLADDAVLADVTRDVSAELCGAGPLEALLALPGVTDVLVNSPEEVWIDRGGGLERTRVRFPDDVAARRLAQRLAAAAGRRLDDAAPFVDAALPDGTRLHVVLPPLVRHTTMSLRVLARRPFSIGELVGPPVGELLRAIVLARLALLISGGAGAGKTTLLGALLGSVPPDERLVVIEDARELVIEHPHAVRLVTRMPNIEGAGAIGARELVRQALRMRPDRLVIGEFRGAEFVELIMALNTGHEGGAATVHANGTADVPARLTALGALGGLSVDAVTSQVASAIDVLVHVRRDRTGRRSVTEIALLGISRSGLTVEPVWADSHGLLGGAPALAATFAARDVPVPAALR
jgi:pilus assembly protein CpaF